MDYNSATSCCNWPFLNSLSVSSPPPMLFPPINTLGTVDRPVRSFRALWIIAPSSLLFLTPLSFFLLIKIDIHIGTSKLFNISNCLDAVRTIRLSKDNNRICMNRWFDVVHRKQWMSWIKWISEQLLSSVWCFREELNRKDVEFTQCNKNSLVQVKRFFMRKTQQTKHNSPFRCKYLNFAASISLSLNDDTGISSFFSSFSIFSPLVV